MDANQLLADLRQERSVLDAAVQLLESRLGSPKAPRTRGTGSKKKHARKFSAAARKAMSLRLKAVWAAKKAKKEARSKAAKAAAKK
jgi:hypothetical protein